MTRTSITLRTTSPEEKEFLEAMTKDMAGDEHSRRRAAVVLSLLAGKKLHSAAEQAGVGIGTARKILSQYNKVGWTGLLTIQPPRGGDFLARYDQGYWAEHLATVCLDQSAKYRAIPYGTSRSEPFTDLHTFRQFAINEFLLQAW